MKQDSTEVIENSAVVATEAPKAVVESKDDDFLAGVQAADAESFNVCISCD